MLIFYREIEMKTVVVTGASEGIGADLARQLAEKKIMVYAVARNAEKLQLLKKSYPDYIIPVVADLSTKAGIYHVITTVSQKKIDALVNNAALLEVKAIKDRTFEDYNRLYNTNVVAPALLISQLHSAGAFTENARIINVSSPAATNVHPGLSAYSMSKVSLNKFTECAQVELFPQGNTLIAWFNPGEVETRMQEQLRQFPAVAALFQKAQQEERLISPSLSAQWLAWLLLEAPKEAFTHAKTIYNRDYYSRWLKSGQTVAAPADFTKNETHSVSDLWAKPSRPEQTPIIPTSSTHQSKL
jgi:short-subunit dehydrogenase